MSWQNGAYAQRCQGSRKPNGMADLFDPANNIGWGVTLDIVGTNVNYDEFRMSWDLTISDAPQDIFNFITPDSKIVYRFCPKLQ